MFDKPHILLIDDDEDDLEMLTTCLKKTAFEIRTFTSGHKAMGYFALPANRVQMLPCLIIMDHNMPRMNGHEVLMLLKENALTKAIPVILYSTSITAAFKEASLKLGAHACFIKPFTYAELCAQALQFERVANLFVQHPLAQVKLQPSLLPAVV